MLRFAGVGLRRALLRVMSTSNCRFVDHERIAHITSAFDHAQAGSSEAVLESIRHNYTALNTVSKYTLWQSKLPLKALKKYAQAACKTDWGLDFLISIRGDILRNHQSVHTENMPHSPIFLELLKSQIQVSLLPHLQLALINTHSSIAMQQKIVDYETVHPMVTIQELVSRMRPQRLVFAYTHPQLADPLAFIEVALTKDITPSIQTILNEKTDKHDSVDTAMFYSINSTMKGLSGIDLGARLIHSVVPLIRELQPCIHNFCTLSPVPSFHIWLSKQWPIWEAENNSDDGIINLAGRLIRLSNLITCKDVSILALYKVVATNVKQLGTFIEDRQWVNNVELNHVAGRILTKICQKYVKLV